MQGVQHLWQQGLAELSLGTREAELSPVQVGETPGPFVAQVRNLRARMGSPGERRLPRLPWEVEQTS